MSRRQLAAIGAGLALLLLAAGAWFFFTHFERVEEDVEVGFQGAAGSNPFLAAERLFSRLGAPGRTLPAGPRTLPPADHALLLLSPDRAVSAEQLEAILAWVRQGGRLLVAMSAAPSLDPTFRHWKLQATEPAEDDDSPEVLAVPLAGGSKASVEIRPGPRLQPAPGPSQVAIASQRGGFVILRYAEGAGSVTFLADAGFLTNAEIGLHNHADLAWALVRAGGEPPKGVWIAVRDEAPTLAGLLTRHAWMALLSCGLLIATWLWASGARFGPLLPEPPRDRRSLLEHVEASGAFLWRTGRGEALALGARQALLDRIDLREPGWSRLPPGELVQRLAAAVHLPVPRVNRALHGAITTPADLVHALQTLETLRRSL